VEETQPNSAKRAPYGRRTYFARALWLLVQSTFWKLAWKRIPVLRTTLLRVFGAQIPSRVLISERVRVHFPWALTIGRHVAIGPDVDFYNLGGISIGNRVIISQNVLLCGGTHDYQDARYGLITAKITIEDDVWIAAGAFVGPGVRVGTGAVIGARAVVVKDVAPWTVVAGNPCRVIKQRKMRSDSA